MTWLMLGVLAATAAVLWRRSLPGSAGDRRLAALVSRNGNAPGRAVFWPAIPSGRAGGLPPIVAGLVGRLPLLSSRGDARVSRDDIADVTGRLAALARAGVPTVRAWQLLAVGHGQGAAIAAVVSGMASTGGSVGDGLRLAADRQPGHAGVTDAVRWLAITSDVVDRSGAPSALVYDGLAAGVLAELAHAEEQEVALAGPRLTATMLSALPVAGAGLGLLMGANVPAALVTTPVGRLCLVAGGVAWLGGRWWTRRLVASAARVR